MTSPTRIPDVSHDPLDPVIVFAPYCTPPTADVVMTSAADHVPRVIASSSGSNVPTDASAA
jgi:hypothetical protein